MEKARQQGAEEAKNPDKDWRWRIEWYFPFSVDGHIGFDRKGRGKATIQIPKDNFFPEGDLLYPKMLKDQNIDLVVVAVKRKKELKKQNGVKDDGE